MVTELQEARKNLDILKKTKDIQSAIPAWLAINVLVEVVDVILKELEEVEALLANDEARND